MENPLQDFDL